MRRTFRFWLLSWVSLVGTGCGGIGLQPFNSGGDDPTLLVQPNEELVFDARPPGTGSSEASVTLQSATSAVVIVESIEIQGENAGAFSLGDLSLPRALRPGAEITAVLGFRPPNVGNFVAELVIVGANTGGSVTRDLRGEGCPDQDTDNLCDNRAPQGPPTDTQLTDDTGF